jgi:6-phospho-beta-glucosidase
LKYIFPKNFIWGAATAAIQIEGAAREGGKGLSQWDVFCEKNPDKIFEAATPEIACDHYHRYKEDVQLMKECGLNGYRLSIAWTRIFPEGFGKINQEGIKFYRSLFEELLSNGIEPNVTLYHWDLPQSLVEIGGWENKDVIQHFVDYASQCFESFGDLVRKWVTFNEPGWSTLQSYMTGLHPPCKKDPRSALQVSHNILVAHAKTIEAFRSQKKVGEIGIVLNMSPIYSVSKDIADQKAALFADGILNRWFAEPVLIGNYPKDIWELYKSCDLLPKYTAEELQLIQKNLVDFIGVNYYYPQYASSDAPESIYHLNTSGKKEEDCKFAIKNIFRFVKNPQGKFTNWGWEIHPEGLSELLERVHHYRPNIPIYVTENGIGLIENLNEHQSVDDHERIDFVREHLIAAYKTLQKGVNLKGYYMWSLMDNFSWINGYKKRYGFLFVDRKTQKRHLKKSAYWFNKVSKENGF